MAARKNGDSTRKNQVEIHRFGEMFKSSASFSTRLEMLQKGRMMKMSHNQSFGSSVILHKNKYKNLDIPVIIPSPRLQDRSITD